MFSKLFNLLISCFALSESVFLVHAVACKAKQIGSIDYICNVCNVYDTFSYFLF